MVRAYIKLKKDWMGVNPLPEKLILGKEDWLYLADYGTADDCRRVLPFVPAELDILRARMEKTAETLRMNGIKFMLVIAPDKHSIYPEYLPDNVVPINDLSRLDQFTEAMAGVDFPYIDLRSPLLAQKPCQSLYLTRESHWSDSGAFLGYTEIIERAKRLLPGINQVTLNDCHVFNGFNANLDLAKLLGASESISEPSIRIQPTNYNNIQRSAPAVAFPPGQDRNPEYAFTLKNDSLPNAPTAVIFRDSFTSAMIPFLARSFSSITFISNRTVDMKFVLAEKPDIVIVVSVERHIDLLKNQRPFLSE